MTYDVSDGLANIANAASLFVEGETDNSPPIALGDQVFGNGTPSPITGDEQANTETANRQGLASVAALEGGGFVINWLSILQDGSGFGEDYFVYTDSDEGRDLITDFVSGEDRFAIHTEGFIGLSIADGVNLVEGAGVSAVGTAAQFLFDTNTGILSYDADGIGAAAEVDIVELGGVFDIAESDFLWV